jgi:hypothetical protein
VKRLRPQPGSHQLAKFPPRPKVRKPPTGQKSANCPDCVPHQVHKPPTGKNATNCPNGLANWTNLQPRVPPSQRFSQRARVRPNQV